ncbi:MAG: hypothetical protein UT02_C0017G0008 [Parcubacteria group bacterium GW2011_GWC2_38_7]|nr:MAG: hypothetical protein UT02_C0017G0008 [Parcubacteria group bacterium GW2011_GWC2_38_7]
MNLASSGATPEKIPGLAEPQEQNLTEVSPGVQIEQQAETVDGDARTIIGSEATPLASPVVATPVAPVALAPVIAKSEDLVAIEKILSEGLEDLYSKLPDNRKAEFRQKGEEAASTIETMMQSAKVQMKKVIGVIRDWLLMIPGVNKFFLEQETKIKADKLLEYKAGKEGQL